MRILHVYKDYLPVRGGIESHIQALAEAQAVRGHEVGVLVTSRDGAEHIEAINGVRVIYASRLMTLASTPISLKLPVHLRREDADVVHLHFPYPWAEVANILCGRGRRTVLTYHSDIVRQRFLAAAYAPLMQQVLMRVDAIIATSPNYLASSPVLARWKHKCTVVPLGIDPRRFARIEANRVGVLREQFLGPAAAAPVILFVGKLRYYKGVNHLLEALTGLPQARLIVVGAGPMETQWTRYAGALGVDTRVRFAGEVDAAELPAYYAAADVVVLPSTQRSEAFGTVQLEAMAAGKPVVCTELGTGTGFVNVDGVTGLVVPPRDSGALAAALRRLIDDPDLRARMGAAGRERVGGEFNLDKLVEGVLGVYEETNRPQSSESSL
jgi:rhamnosyl/mannosyltransferase